VTDHKARLQAERDALSTKAKLKARYDEARVQRVSKPLFAYNGCWAEKRVYIGQMFPTFQNCRKQARLGKLTCRWHDDWEPLAQEERDRLAAAEAAPRAVDYEVASAIPADYVLITAHTEEDKARG
jgi:hypothetical protein